MRINIDENRKQVNLFLENKVYTFVNEYRPNGFEFQYNGFILELKKDDTVVFFDVVKKKTIFLLLSFCTFDYSNGQIIPEDEALKIFKIKEDENGENKS